MRLKVLGLKGGLCAADGARRSRIPITKSQNLHSTDFACISYLQHIGVPVSAKQLLAQLNLTSGSGTALLDRLESAGFIHRLPNPEDRRSILIELDTERAEGLLRRLRKVEPTYRAVMDSFSADELKSIVRFLEEMSAFAKSLG